MSADLWYVVVSYDVANNRRRAKAAKVLRAYGERVQKSVFDCRLDEKRLLELEERLRKVIDESADSVRFYRLCSACERNVCVHGWGTVQEDEDVIIV